VSEQIGFDPGQLIGPDDILIEEPQKEEKVAGALIPDSTGFNENTLTKVREGLRRVLGSEQVITDMIFAMQNEGILFREHLPVIAANRIVVVVSAAGDVYRTIVVPPGYEVSDGHHTFDELYDHRRKLTAVLATIAAVNDDAWRSKLHHPDDGPMFDGSFIVGIELPAGPITYHYPLDSWDEFAAVAVLEHAPKWDGAGPPETLVRLADFADNLKKAIDEGRAVQEQARTAADAAVAAAEVGEGS
jgi:hypothetical protein